MKLLRPSLLAVAILPVCFAATLSISTYLKDGLTPSSVASDPQGNIYIAGSALVDPASRVNGAVVAKVDPKVSQYLYLTYLDSSANDQVTGITVDSAGNAYVTGWTTNPNFPVVGSTALGTAPAGSTDARSFVVKLSPQGAVIISILIGGSAMSEARGIALTAQGRILVSGVALSKGYPATSGAYSVADTTQQWFLTELDATADQMVFSATGIGGSSIVLDSSGNIYLAGSFTSVNYPTTPGAYQPTLVQGTYCFELCQIDFPGNVQHVTKVDPMATRLIYSTGLGSLTGGAGSITNTGLAVDSAGNAYVTGTLFESSYPFTVPAPAGAPGFLTKLDPAGANALFSIPAGGAGVAVDSTGALYVGGIVSNIDPVFQPVPLGQSTAPAAFSSIPALCVPNNITSIAESYVAKVDPASGNLLDGQWINGSGDSAVALTLASGKVWVIGATPASDVPFTPGVLAPAALGPGFLEGAFLSAVDFSAGVNTGPQIACTLDSGNLTHTRAVTAFQLLTIMGSNLGPATSVTAPPGGAPSLGGVTVTFDGNNPAQLLYVSSTQINLAVPAPLPSQAVGPLPSSTVMQLNVNNLTIQRQFPYTPANLSLFANLSTSQITCAPAHMTVTGFQPLVLNADGSVNSCNNPAKYGSTVSFFMHGVGAIQLGFPPASELPNIQASVGSCSAAVTSALIDGFVYQLAVTLPAGLAPCNNFFSMQAGETDFPVAFSSNGFPAGPFMVPATSLGPSLSFTPPGQQMPMVVWITP